MDSVGQGVYSGQAWPDIIICYENDLVKHHDGGEDARTSCQAGATGAPSGQCSAPFVLFPTLFQIVYGPNDVQI